MHANLQSKDFAWVTSHFTNIARSSPNSSHNVSAALCPVHWFASAIVTPTAPVAKRRLQHSIPIPPAPPVTIATLSFIACFFPHWQVIVSNIRLGWIHSAKCLKVQLAINWFRLSWIRFTNFLRGLKAFYVRTCWNIFDRCGSFRVSKLLLGKSSELYRRSVLLTQCQNFCQTQPHASSKFEMSRVVPRIILRTNSTCMLKT